MKIPAYFLCTLFLLLAPVANSPAATADWRDVVRDLESANARAADRARQVEELVRQDRSTLEAVLKNYREQAADAESRLKPLTAEYERLKETEEKLRADLAKEREEIENIQGTVFGFARQSGELFEDSLLGADLAAERAAVDEMVARKKFPGLAEIETVVRLFTRYREASAEVRSGEGTFIGGDGRPNQGRVARIGALAAVYSADGEQGYLVPTNNGRELSAVAGTVPGWVESRIRHFIAEGRGPLPLDLSGGGAFLKMTNGKSLTETFKAGGSLVWPILGIGVLALLLSVERGLFFLRVRSNSDRIIDDVAGMVEKDSINECVAYCRANGKSPLCQVLASGLRHLGQSQQVLENALHEALLQQIPRFERFLPTLAMFAGIAPLLGLLGTVTGMIGTFQVINLFGTGDPRMMSGGISEALITTQLGLVVAIPILFVHHLFERKVDLILTDMEEKGTAFMISMLKSGHVREAKDEQPLPSSL
ncbi:MAG: MotA/TolQ/ExbB proton channel family protein [Syntrophotaleaceae bacterium]